ncbi:Uncharacterised protein [Mycobacteroides abscessus subsp. abscessus]|nr:Uncharacterised protein [Mycobacteroides abscessus subsp. abscessus]
MLAPSSESQSAMISRGIVTPNSSTGTSRSGCNTTLGSTGSCTTSRNRSSLVPK